jgi:uncharacterized protein (DUF305 family)
MKSSKLGISAAVIAAAVVVIIMILIMNTGNDDDHTKMKASSNSTDVSFAQGMIPHHEQAIEMAKLVSSRSDNEDVKALAEDIVNAQDPEIKKLRAFLKSVDEPENSSHSMHGEESMNEQMGMATEDQLSEMQDATGPEFDQLFLDHMIRHHEGAVDMANEELKDGTNSDMKTLARDIISAQEKEITLMKKLQS